MKSVGDSPFEIGMCRQLLLGETLARNARKCPDLDAVIFKDKRIIYRELDDRVNRLANALISAGINKGDSIGLMMENRQEMLEIFFAVAKIGAVNVPVNIRLSPPETAPPTAPAPAPSSPSRSILTNVLLSRAKALSIGIITDRTSIKINNFFTDRKEWFSLVEFTIR